MQVLLVDFGVNFHRYAFLKEKIIFSGEYILKNELPFGILSR
ncbi:hypothetical protein BC751_1982 [Cecembia calidifontis]|jgi:hypothetical protein|uniref:Uncharacterized protein n=2 Tax=Cecembia TaxID=1187078 RepID=A0A4Q7P8H1_9BACT|nr:hypothetical protein CLV48_10451 [Cecembia rubra]RZS96411.1 hypothetical protein BC751_1982 [Cecembia calidifontis]